MEQPQTTYKEQDMTWEDLKRPKTACNEQGTTGNNRNDLRRHTITKKLPEAN